MKEATQEALAALSEGISAELAAYVFYKRAADKVSDNELRETLEKLAGDEKDHYWLLEGEYDSLVRSEKWVSYNDVMRREGLPEIPEEMAEPHRKRLENLDTTKDPKGILRMAIELEEEARDFYKSQMESVDDPAAVEMYSFLSKFEQGHVNTLTSLLAR